MLLATSLGLATARNHPSGMVNALGGFIAGVGFGVVFALPIMLQMLLVRSRVISWVVGLSLLVICSWIAAELLTGDRVAAFVAVSSSLYGFLILIPALPVFFVLLFVRPQLIIELLAVGSLSISVLATLAILLGDASTITAGVPLIVAAAIGGVVIDRSLRQAAAT